jgi:hypothetical protein
MKTITLSLLLLLQFSPLFARKVKFSVDMTGQVVNINGVHITGDFQSICGLGSDWDPATAALTQEGTTSVYSIIVNLPAFRKYEYRFVNGIETYEAEFVPDESRVGYDMVDNRWLYVDSLRNDTAFTGKILFAGNAPAGLKLIRYKVDMRVAGPVSTRGIHVAASYQSSPFSPTEKRLYSFGNGIYEIIDFAPVGTYTFVYLNGDVNTTAEMVSGSCASNSMRTIVLAKDTALETVCFTTCKACVGVGIDEQTSPYNALNIYPNPSTSEVTIDYPATVPVQLKITDLSGRTILSAAEISSGYQVRDLPAGFYQVTLTASDGMVSNIRLIVNR